MGRNDRKRIADIMDELMHLHPDKVDQTIARPSLRAWFVGRVFHIGQIGEPRSVVEEIVNAKFDALLVAANA